MMSAMSDVETKDVTTTESQPRLYRSRDRKVIAGVSAGLGDYFALDPVWFRLGFVVLALGGGSGILIYLLMWLIVPYRPSDDDSVSAAPAAPVSGTVVIGMVLMFVGTIALVNTLAPWLGQYFWPVILVVGGLAVVLGGLGRDTR